MRKACITALLLAAASGAQAQFWSKEFNYLEQYMGINVFGGYAYQTYRHASFERFVTSFNQVFASQLSSPLMMPGHFQAPVIGAELSAGAIRIGYAHRFTQPMRLEARYKNGSYRRMEIETPKNSWYIDLLLPIAKGRVFAGATMGTDFGYYRLRSYMDHNFGRITYANGDGVSGIFNSHLDIHGRLGGRLDVNLMKRVSISLRAETYNTIITAPESAMNGWRDELYSDASLSNVQERRVYLSEDVNQRFNDYITLGNTLWETSPAVYGNPKGVVYSVTANVLILSYRKKK